MRRSIPCPLGALLWAAILLPVATGDRLIVGQAVRAVAIDDEEGCRGCSLGVERRWSVRDPFREAVLGPDQASAMDSQGWWYVVAEPALDQVLLITPSGVVAKRVGRPGAGPGEFRRIHHLAIGRSDSLYTWDATLRRITVFSPAPEPAAVRQFSLPVSLDVGGFVVLSDGSILANGEYGHASAIGLPLHRFDQAGGYVGSFGSQGEVYRRGDPNSLGRLIAVSPEGIWTLRGNEYLLELWSLDGTRQRVLRRHAAWFAPYSQPPISATEAPKPLPVGVVARPDGLLLVMILVADRRWRSGLIRKQGPHGVYADVGDYERYFDTVIEVIDPRSASLTTATRLDGFFRRFLAGEYLSGYRDGLRGDPALSTWRITFTNGR